MTTDRREEQVVGGRLHRARLPREGEGRAAGFGVI
jgi:hypothetical protein